MISQGAPVFRGEDRQWESPLFSVLMCKMMKKCMLEQVVVHDLWLLACILHPFLKEFSFLQDDQKRVQYKPQGEGMVRSLKSHRERAAFSGPLLLINRKSPLPSTAHRSPSCGR